MGERVPDSERARSGYRLGSMGYLEYWMSYL